MIELILQTVAALAFVVFLILLLALGYRKRNRDSGLIRLVSYQAIGQKMGVAALKIGGEIFILGVTPTDFKVLKRMDGKAAEAVSPAGAGNGLQPKKPVGAEKGGVPAKRDRIAETIEKIKDLRGKIDG